MGQLLTAAKLTGNAKVSPATAMLRSTLVLTCAATALRSSELLALFPPWGSTVQ
jgi:hypothetical protein